MSEFKTFPSCTDEAIAYLYVQKSDTAGKTPEEMYMMYQEAYYTIRREHHRRHADGWFKAQQESVRD